MARGIETRITIEDYRAGEVLPPEPVLEREFRVSRITIPQARGLLKRRGLLYSRSGLGTLVRVEGTIPQSARMTGSLGDLICYGAEAEYCLIERALVVSPGPAPRCSECRPGQRSPVPAAPRAGRVRPVSA